VAPAGIDDDDEEEVTPEENQGGVGRAQCLVSCSTTRLVMLYMVYVL
jgi:hypothetical protein